MRPDDEPDSAQAPWSVSSATPPAQAGNMREDTLAIIYRNIEDVIYQFEVEDEERFRFVNVDWVGHLEQFGLPPPCINVEITEGLLLNLSDTVLAKLATLQASRMQISIDDFGTGYSSMSYLKRLDIDYLKIDQSFVAELVHDNFSRTITETIIVMAHKLGLKVIAEGVETAEQRDYLIAAGCDYAQGYLFSRPVPAPAFEALLGLR